MSNMFNPGNCQLTVTLAFRGHIWDKEKVAL